MEYDYKRSGKCLNEQFYMNQNYGKTYIVKEFGKANYESVVYIYFRTNSIIHSVFDGDFDINLMIMAITANDPKARFILYKALIILDEIQA